MEAVYFNHANVATYLKDWIETHPGWGEEDKGEEDDDDEKGSHHGDKEMSLAPKIFVNCDSVDPAPTPPAAWETMAGGSCMHPSEMFRNRSGSASGSATPNKIQNRCGVVSVVVTRVQMLFDEVVVGSSCLYCNFYCIALFIYFLLLFQVS